MENTAGYALNSEFQNCGKGRGKNTILQVAREIASVVVVIAMPDGTSRPVTLDDDGETEVNVPIEATLMARCADPDVRNAVLIVGEAG